MKELEEILGAPLVERGPRQIRLTGAGRGVRPPRARHPARRWMSWPRWPGRRPGRLSGRLRIGVIPTIAPYLLPRVLRQLGQRFPDLDLRPREAVTPSWCATWPKGGLTLPWSPCRCPSPGWPNTRCSTRNSCWSARIADAAAPGAAARRPAPRCRFFCWRRATASAIRRSPPASCPAPRRARSWRARPSPPWSRWSAPGSA